MIYDLIVIGGGPAGYLGAERAGHAGLKTLLIEKRAVGGVCLNEGCIPSKTLLYSAKIFDNAKNGKKYGVHSDSISLDHKSVINRKNKIIKTLISGINLQLKRNKVTLIKAAAKIKGKNEEGYLVEANGEIYNAKRLLIATGSVPVIPPISGVSEGIEKGYVLTNREILDLEAIPSSLVVVGGGVIGLEMASYFNSAGSKVTIIEMLDHIAGDNDREISEMLLKSYQKKGIEFKLNSKVIEVSSGKVIYESDGNTFEAPADKVLISIGRKPFTEDLGLETIGVEVGKKGVLVDETGKTNIPNVYAAGDINGTSMLAHTAYREAEVCINNMLGKKDIMRYNAIPSAIYTNPEVASVGETESTAKIRRLDIEVAKIPMAFSGRYLAENEGEKGICKIIIEKCSRKLLGVQMIGNYASEIIYGAALMIELELKVEDVKELVFPHPTVSEIIREGIFTL